MRVTPVFSSSSSYGLRSTINHHFAVKRVLRLLYLTLKEQIPLKYQKEQYSKNSLCSMANLPNARKTSSFRLFVVKSKAGLRLISLVGALRKCCYSWLI